MSNYEYTDPEEVASDEAKAALIEVRKFYALPGNTCGGVLHIVTDDGNVETEHVLFCLDLARGSGDSEGERIANLLLELSEGERQFIYANK